MKLYDVSQLPVLDGERIVGIVDESDVLLAVVTRRRAGSATPVRTRDDQRARDGRAGRAARARCCRSSSAGIVAIVVDGDVSSA